MTLSTAVEAHARATASFEASKHYLHTLIAAEATLGKSNYALHKEVGLSQPTIARIVDAATYDDMIDAVEADREVPDPDAIRAALKPFDKDAREAHFAFLDVEGTPFRAEYDSTTTIERWVGENSYSIEKAPIVVIKSGNTQLRRVEIKGKVNPSNHAAKIAAREIIDIYNSEETERIEKAVTRLQILNLLAHHLAEPVPEYDRLIRYANSYLGLSADTLISAMKRGAQKSLNPRRYPGHAKEGFVEEYIPQDVHTALAKEDNPHLMHDHGLEMIDMCRRRRVLVARRAAKQAE